MKSEPHGDWFSHLGIGSLYRRDKKGDFYKERGGHKGPLTNIFQYLVNKGYTFLFGAAAVLAATPNLLGISLRLPYYSASTKLSSAWVARS
ncbi:hypothetical protein F652_2478 [Enterobacteriaceae bacterium bta3-1]|nr:hypothetical protein F652_2478 [Enterobacteriaceae bacterium bta3-1]